MAFTNSPNMGLPIPAVGSEPGPNYAFDINSALTLVDQHDHSPGKGIQITPAGLNINADLSFQGNNATLLNSVEFQAQASPDSTLLSLYVAPGLESPTPINDLWFTDGVGNQIQLTSNGEVNATIASLPGESFAFGTFFWKQGAGSTTPANFDIGSITLRPNIAATTFGVVLSPPAGISSQYNISLPLLPVGNSLVTINSSGVMSTILLPLTGSNIASQTITAANIANNTITKAQLAPSVYTWDVQSFTSSGSFVVPAGVNEVWVVCIGGGGGGQSSNRSQQGGQGGGGSVPQARLIDVVAAETLTVVVGTGGTGGSSASGNLTNGTAGTISSMKRGNNLLIESLGGLGGGAAGSGASTWTPTLMSVAAGAGGLNINGSPGSDNSYASGGTFGEFSGTNSRGGGGGGGAGFGVGGAGSSVETYIFTLSAAASIVANTIFTNNGQTFVCKATTSSSTSLLCNGTGSPTASGTLTYFSGPTPGNLTYTSFIPDDPPASKFGSIGGLGGGGGGGAAGSPASGDGAGAGGNGGGGTVIVYWLGTP